MNAGQLNMAFFKVAVEEVVFGEAEPIVDVIWNTKLYYEPSKHLPQGRYLFVLEKPRSLIVSAPITSLEVPTSNLNIYQI